jgi:hypothetical protein
MKRSTLFKLMLIFSIVFTFTAVAFAQSSDPQPPGISQIVEGIMSAVGTYLAAWVANKIRKALGVSDRLFLSIIIPLLGLGVSWLVNTLGQPGNSWLVSFAMTLGATWLDQLIRKFRENT